MASAISSGDGGGNFPRLVIFAARSISPLSRARGSVRQVHNDESYGRAQMLKFFPLKGSVWLGNKVDEQAGHVRDFRRHL